MKLREDIMPRSWQSAALEIWSRALRGVVQVVTGGGKTVFAYLCLSRFFSHYPQGRAIVIVPTVALLDQWFLDIVDATDLDDADVACYWGRSRPERPGRVNLVVLNSARHLARELAIGAPTCLVVDECHRAGADQNSLALAGEHKAALGLSATPERFGDEGFELRVVPKLGPIIFEYGYLQAKSDDVIVDFDLVNVEIATDGGLKRREGGPSLLARETLTDWARQAADRELTESESRRAIIARQRAMRVPWAVKLALSHRAERIIVFHERIGSVLRIATLLTQQGQNSVAYHSHLSEAHRRDNLRMFRRGIVNVLVTCRALDEGADVPEANVAIVAQSTSSTRQRIQRLGRVLRPAPSKSRALVYTLYSGEEERDRLAEEATALQGVASIGWKQGKVR